MNDDGAAGTAAPDGGDHNHASHDHAGHSHAGHDHSHSDSATTSGLIAAASLNSVFAVVQVLVGLAVGSIVVLADAAHQVVDAFGLVTAMIAVILMSRPTSTKMSFGWGKADALGGFVSGSLLAASTVWIAYESIKRLLNPTEVEASGVILIGIAGLIVNGGSVLILGNGRDVLAVRAARLHLLTDLAGSAVVVVTGLILSGTSLTWIDPVASLAVCALVIRSTSSLLLSAMSELLDRVPAQISSHDVASTLSAQPGVLEVHHVHVRPLGRSRTSVTAHVVVDGNQSLHDAQERTNSLTSALEASLSVAHSTLQLECHPCSDDSC